MDASLRSLTDVLEDTDALVRSGQAVGATPVATGFHPLDTYLGGGLRAGELTLLGGPQGLGKTTLALQMARNVATSGSRVLYFGFEHDETTVLARLTALEAGLLAGPEAMTLKQVRLAMDESAGDVQGLSGRLAKFEAGPAALQAVRGFGPWLHLHRSDGRRTSVDVIRELVLAERGDHPPLVIVDYLQKVPVPGGPPLEDERMTLVVEGLKDLALEAEAPVLAIVAADKEGLNAGGRLRISHLRGSSALAYEADVVLMLNDKYQVVARHHLVYGAGAGERFRDWVVVTIEKNRGGLDRIDLEFRKQFEFSRFDPNGQAVTEQLLDERVFTE